MRRATVLVIRATTLLGSADSAAAMVAISAPTRAKITLVTPPRTGHSPLGMKPPWATRLEKVGPVGEVTPNTKSPAIRMKTMIAATFMDENQNSNSPYERVESRFTPVSAAISATPMAHTGAPGTHSWMILAPAIASIATTTTQKYQ